MGSILVILCLLRFSSCKEDNDRISERGLMGNYNLYRKTSLEFNRQLFRFCWSILEGCCKFPTVA
jgi:hypothetical protein